MLQAVHLTGPDRVWLASSNPTSHEYHPSLVLMRRSVYGSSRVRSPSPVTSICRVNADGPPEPHHELYLRDFRRCGGEAPAHSNLGSALKMYLIYFGNEMVNRSALGLDDRRGSWRLMVPRTGWRCGFKERLGSRNQRARPVVDAAHSAAIMWRERRGMRLFWGSAPPRSLLRWSGGPRSHLWLCSGMVAIAACSTAQPECQPQPGLEQADRLGRLGPAAGRKGIRQGASEHARGHRHLRR